MALKTKLLERRVGNPGFRRTIPDSPFLNKDKGVQSLVPSSESRGVVGEESSNTNQETGPANMNTLRNPNPNLYTRPAPGNCYRCGKPGHCSNTCPEGRPVNWMEEGEEDTDVPDGVKGENDLYEGAEIVEDDGERVNYVVQRVLYAPKQENSIQRNVEQIGNEDDQHNDDDLFYPSDELNGNVNMSSTNIPLTQSNKKGKKRSRNEDPIVDFLKDSVKEFGNMQAAASDSIRRLTDCFQFEADGAIKRMKVFDELKKIDGMTNAQQVKVGQLLVHDQANIDYFFTLDEEFKLDFLLSLLE
ncbi:hypothetical protein LWI29_016689 [Acer saccharum]|uniref:CCHC-type domain-containing protein n=1 Tax=Acer saccharum TaxID=4024 RepID=A0AA39VKL5_ACESA|nr:hypothetical protein LWI29_016689 [Acer saccharum]